MRKASSASVQNEREREVLSKADILDGSSMSRSFGIGLEVLFMECLSKRECLLTVWSSTVEPKKSQNS